MRKADGKCRRAIMSPVTHLPQDVLSDCYFAGDGELVWDPTDEAKPSFDDAKLF